MGQYFASVLVNCNVGKTKTIWIFFVLTMQNQMKRKKIRFCRSSFSRRITRNLGFLIFRLSSCCKTKEKRNLFLVPYTSLHFVFEHLEIFSFIFSSAFHGTFFTHCLSIWLPANFTPITIVTEAAKLISCKLVLMGLSGYVSETTKTTTGTMAMLSHPVYKYLQLFVNSMLMMIT